ncbi:NAD-dependent epimerase [Paraglaciecola hydrolytica]|uniref:Capsular biosynthesis protein CpsI n=1 Tax=Paraglaciecola hydrolytica TaxID=1799789 RepID=A0A135ZZY2_9ALTE|nr:NAD-dependent epimerase [Paraglaciecola hydrolytica]KXI28524.1 capsular biosynthesis protein CpsI [Paraglaciecola hydrolytica]
MKVLVTGVAGFIGFHVANYLISRGDTVVGIDNINDYYDIKLKQGRLQELAIHKDAHLFTFIKMDIAERSAMETLFAEQQFDKVIHLAAQAGVRYSIENPHAYIDSNIVGFMNILEGCRHHKVQHLVYASSSSVYGANEAMPFSVKDNVDHPVSLYAASKKANELMAHTYSHLYELPTTGLRFFTVYGPWGRPDMALFKFTQAILKNQAIDVYNFGNHRRDFTYIDDIVKGIILSLDQNVCGNKAWNGQHPDPSTSKAPWKIYNIGAQTPVNLLEFIETLETALGKTAQKNLLPMQAGDVPDTYADVSALNIDVGYNPSTNLVDGIGQFVSWYKKFYG